MIYTINAVRQDEPPLIIRIKSDLERHDLIPSIKAAVAQFQAENSRARDQAMQSTCNQFNWGDLALWIPARITLEHKFEIIAGFVVDFTVDHDESLLPENPDET